MEKEDEFRGRRNSGVGGGGIISGGSVAGLGVFGGGISGANDVHLTFSFLPPSGRSGGRDWGKRARRGRGGRMGGLANSSHPGLGGG